MDGQDGQDKKGDRGANCPKPWSHPRALFWVAGVDSPIAYIMDFFITATLATALLTQTPTNQSKPAPTNATPPATPASSPAAVNFAEDPLVVDSVGLTFRIPAGARVQTSNIAAANNVAILAPDLSSWVINVQTPTTANPTSTPKDAAERTINDLLARVLLRDSATKELVGSEGRVLERTEKLVVEGSATPAARFYVSLPALGRTGDARTIYGYTIFKPQPTQYVVFELICSDNNYQKARRLYELSVASATFQDPEKLASTRQNAVATGAALLSRLTTADFDAACAEPQRWFRLYEPAPSGKPEDAAEHGYRGLRFFKGTRAQIDMRITADSPKAAANETNPAGYLANLSARLLRGTGLRGVYQLVDVEGVYFTTPLRDQEAWSIRMVVKEGGSEKSRVYTETGTRGGRSMTVISDLPGQPNRTLMPSVPPDGYLTQVERFLLPRLMTRIGLEGETAFYCYQTKTQAISLRRDVLAKQPGTADVWSIVTRERESAEPQKYLYKNDGSLIRAELEDGIAMEPSTLEDINAIWKSKGLPVGK